MSIEICLKCDRNITNEYQDHLCRLCASTSMLNSRFVSSVREALKNTEKAVDRIGFLLAEHDENLKATANEIERERAEEEG